MKSKLMFVSLLVVTVGLLAGVSSLLFWHPPVLAAEAGTAGVALDPRVLSWGYVAAALATGIAALGAAYAVASVASAAVGALTEKPELFGRLVILVGLAEGIAIYGVIISVLILNSLRG